MARPIKSGLDYFPHNCIPDQRVELIEAEFGLTGYAIIFKLYEKIFVEKGYFCEWTKDVTLMFARRNGVGVNVVSEIVNASIRRGIFDSGLFKKYSILTSREIQETYFEVISKLKRTRLNLIQEYLLENCTLSEVFSEKKVVSSEKTRVYSCENPHKRKEKKRKESKVNSSSRDTATIKIPCKNGVYEVTEQQLQLLQSCYKNIDVLESVLQIADYAYNNPDRQRTLDGVENWIRKWLTENDNGKFKTKHKESDAKNAKAAERNMSKTSYDIKSFKDYDIFE